jgi:tetratricopeptide (TPR) repeat protein
LRACERYNWLSLHPIALVERAAADRKLGNIDDAFARLTEVERLCALKPNPEALGRAAHFRGVMLTQMGDLGRARSQLRRALALLTDDPIHQVRCLHLLALVARYESRHDEALQLGTQALRTAERRGIRYLIPMCKLGLGEDARLSGDPIEAERWYREAAAGFEAAGSSDVVTAWLNIGLALMEQEKFEEARPLLEKARAVFEQHERSTYLAAAHVSLLPCAATAKDWKAYDRHLNASKELLEESGFIDYDIPRFCELGARLAEEADERRRAIRGWALAAREWDRLGREDACEAALKRAKALTSANG